MARYENTRGVTSAPRLVPLTLSSVPLKTRRLYGRLLYEAAVADRDILLATQLHAAVEEPSDRVYWLPEKAVRKVLR